MNTPWSKPLFHTAADRLSYDSTKYKGLITCHREKVVQQLKSETVVEIVKPKKKHLKCHMLGTDGQRLSLDFQKYAGLRGFKPGGQSAGSKSRHSEAEAGTRRSSSCTNGGCGV